MNAYTNAVPNASCTVQYSLDSDWDILGTLANTAGTLSTVGQLVFDGAMLDITEDGGFDILSFNDGDNTAFALLTVGAEQGLYEVPLMADADGAVNLTLVGFVPTETGALDGFAVAPSNAVATAPIPVPGSLGLLGGVLGLAGDVASRRRAATAP